MILDNLKGNTTDTIRYEHDGVVTGAIFHNFDDKKYNQSLSTNLKFNASIPFIHRNGSLLFSYYTTEYTWGKKSPQLLIEKASQSCIAKPGQRVKCVHEFLLESLQIDYIMNFKFMENNLGDLKATFRGLWEG